MLIELLVVDLEATCSDDGSIVRYKNTETIEIGAAVVDQDYKIASEFQSFIRPQKNQKLTEFCKGLTGITQEDVDRADLFPIVLERFVDWYESDSFSSWGNFDKFQLEVDCKNWNVIYPFTYHIDLSKEFTKMTGRRKGHRGAMKLLGIESEGKHHRGLDDVRNIVKMLPYLL